MELFKKNIACYYVTEWIIRLQRCTYLCPIKAPATKSSPGTLYFSNYCTECISMLFASCILYRLLILLVSDAVCIAHAIMSTINRAYTNTVVGVKKERHVHWSMGFAE